MQMLFGCGLIAIVLVVFIFFMLGDYPKVAFAMCIIGAVAMTCTGKVHLVFTGILAGALAWGALGLMSLRPNTNKNKDVQQ